LYRHNKFLRQNPFMWLMNSDDRTSQCFMKLGDDVPRKSLLEVLTTAKLAMSWLYGLRLLAIEPDISSFRFRNKP
ncbi:hypothetical protein BMR06_15485, partial [Methylococcaceae bacterium HT5]